MWHPIKDNNDHDNQACLTFTSIICVDFFFLIFIYLAVLVLSCGAQAIYLWCVSSRAAASGVAAEGLSYLGS